MSLYGPAVIPAALTLDELAAWLDPRFERDKLKALLWALDVEPDGKRRSVVAAAAGAGRPALTYRVGKILRIHAAVIPFRHDC